MVEFVKLMAELNQDIKPYVVIGTIRLSSISNSPVRTTHRPQHQLYSLLDSWIQLTYSRH